MDEHVTGWRGRPSQRASGLEVSTPDVSQFTYMGPFTWALFQPQLKIHIPVTVFGFSTSSVLACYPSAKSDCLKAFPRASFELP